MFNFSERPPSKEGRIVMRSATGIGPLHKSGLMDPPGGILIRRRALASWRASNIYNGGGAGAVFVPEDAKSTRIMSGCIVAPASRAADVTAAISAPVSPTAEADSP